MLAGLTRTTTVEAEFLLDHHRVTGTARLTHQSARLTDLLNNVDESLSLTNVLISSLDGYRVDELREMTVEKHAIRVAIPRETEDLLSQQRVSRAGMLRPDLRPILTLILVPPYTVRGNVFASPLTDIPRVDRGRLARFASVANATVFLANHELLSNTFVAVSRDLIDAIGLPKTAGEPIMQPTERPSTRELSDALPAGRQSRSRQSSTSS